MNVASPTRSALILLPEAPYPVIGGGPLRSASIIEGLASQFQLTAIHFQLEGDRDPALDYPARLLKAHHSIDLPHHAKSFLPRLGRNMVRAIRGVPPLVDRFAGHQQKIQQLLKGQHFDLIWVEHFWAATYASILRPHARKLVLDLHNIESAYYDSLACAAPAPHRPLLRHFARRARAYELRLLPLFDLLITTSAQDASRITHSSVQVLPNTIPLHPVPNQAQTPSLVFTGNFAYTPNQQALHWFLDHCWPTILKTVPDCRLRLVGKEIHYAHTTAPNVDYIGPVEDAIEEIAKSRIAIVPLQSGSGTRLKILEAWAAGAAVISTSIGAEGLEAQPGEHLEIADSPETFVQTTLDLFDNTERRFRLGQAARRLYEARYTWHSAHKILSALDL